MGKNCEHSLHLNPQPLNPFVRGSRESGFPATRMNFTVSISEIVFIPFDEPSRGMGLEPFGEHNIF